jgi:hypothetical protein
MFLEHMWGDSFQQDDPRTAAIEPPSSVSRAWINSPKARARTYEEVSSRLMIHQSNQMSDEVKDQIQTIFAETRIADENTWYPENYEREKLQMAVDRCKWYTDAAFRLRIYGEFAQVLFPQYNYEQLPMLPAQHKDPVKSLYVAVLSDGVRKTQYDCLLEALKIFSDQYLVVDASITDRIGRERAARWNVQYAPAGRPMPVMSFVGSPDGWR